MTVCKLMSSYCRHIPGIKDRPKATADEVHISRSMYHENWLYTHEWNILLYDMKAVVIGFAKNNPNVTYVYTG